MNKKGSRWILLGMAMIIASILWASYNIYMTDHAGKAAEAAAKQLEETIPTASTDETGEESPDYVLNPNMDMPVKKLNGTIYIGLLEIPDLGLKLPVQKEWSYSNMKISPCRYEGSIYTNDMVICGHNYTRHFRPLFRIQTGTDVYFTDMDGNRFAYQVMEREILNGNDVEDMISGDWDLTLFTCNSSGTSRVTVRLMKKT